MAVFTLGLNAIGVNLYRFVFKAQQETYALRACHEIILVAGRWFL